MLQSRPLSPHLQIYRWQITSVLSILHRATGIGLCGGIIGFILWLFFLTLGAIPYQNFIHYINTLWGQLILWPIVFCINYHWLNGLRHLIWDAGYGYELKAVYKTGWIVVIISIFLTFLIYKGWY